ncbi:MAG: DUF420 domain-containing protein [Gemmatimonadetes bacterium]|nr:DUF420 domain-containing protein [Gemmatimonadota bacterium]
MSAAVIGSLLAPLNAALNFTSAVFLLAGYRFIRRRQVHRHRACMLGAFTASTIFVVLYVTRLLLTGTHRFAGTGWIRTFYLTVLFSHMTLAVVIVPLVLRLLYLVWRRRFRAHARLARWTFPLWLYVSVTGITVYLMLYHVVGYVP